MGWVTYFETSLICAGTAAASRTGPRGNGTVVESTTTNSMGLPSAVAAASKRRWAVDESQVEIPGPLPRRRDEPTMIATL